MKTLLFCALALLLCGCNAIRSQEPVDLTPKDISNEIEKREGVWSSGKGELSE